MEISNFSPTTNQISNIGFLFQARALCQHDLQELATYANCLYYLDLYHIHENAFFLHNEMPQISDTNLRSYCLNQYTFFLKLNLHRVVVTPTVSQTRCPFHHSLSIIQTLIFTLILCEKSCYWVRQAFPKGQLHALIQEGKILTLFCEGVH